MAIACFTGSAAIAYFLPPEKWWTETMMIITVWLGGWWLTSMIFKKRRLGLWVSVAIIALLLLRRFGLFNWMVFGIWLVLVGLIAIWA